MDIDYIVNDLSIVVAFPEDVKLASEALLCELIGRVAVSHSMHRLRFLYHGGSSGQGIPVGAIGRS